MFLVACSVLLELGRVFPPHHMYSLNDYICLLELCGGIVSAQNNLVTPLRAAFLELGSGKLLRLHYIKHHLRSDISSTAYAIDVQRRLGRQKLVFKI